MTLFDPRRPAIWQPLLFFGLFFAFWQFGVVRLGIKPYLLPRFSAVLAAMWTARADLAQNALVTIIEVITGYFAAVIIGGLLGIFIFVSPFARRTVYPFMTGLQALPKSALAPLMIVWFGLRPARQGRDGLPVRLLPDHHCHTRRPCRHAGQSGRNISRRSGPRPGRPSCGCACPARCHCSSMAARWRCRWR